MFLMYKVQISSTRLCNNIQNDPKQIKTNVVLMFLDENNSYDSYLMIADDHSCKSLTSAKNTYLSFWNL